MLSRYLLKELLSPLLVWVCFVLALLFVMSFLKGTDVLLGSGVTAVDVARIGAGLTPHFLQQALPAAFLLATLIGVGRLAEDGELVAMHAAGIGPWRIFRVPLVLGAVVGLLMLAMTYTLEPWGLVFVRHAANDVIKRNLVGDVRPGVFYEDLSQLALYAEKVETGQRRWEHVLLQDGRDAANPLLVLAKGGWVRSASTEDVLRLELVDGSMHRLSRDEGEYVLADFASTEIVIGVADTFYAKNHFKRPKEELTPLEVIVAAKEAQAAGANPVPMLMTFHWRHAQAFMPIAFALIGTPLAMGGRQSSRTRGFLFALAAYAAYYVLARVCVGLGESGKLSYWFAGHVANLVFAVGGVALAVRASRRGGRR